METHRSAYMTPHIFHIRAKTKSWVRMNILQSSDTKRDWVEAQILGAGFSCLEASIIIKLRKCGTTTGESLGKRGDQEHDGRSA